MNLTALPALSDNDIWMIDDGLAAIAVDPREPAPVATALDAQGFDVAGILVTPLRRGDVGGIDFPAVRRQWKDPPR